MKLLSSLARALVRKEFVAVAARRGDGRRGGRPGRRGAQSRPRRRSLPRRAEKPGSRQRRRHLVAITACPTGIAHTYMAADSLVAAAKEAGVTLHVETQGSSGSTPLDPSTIAGAAAVIFATDVGVKDKGRFAGKPVVASGVKRAINEPAKMVAEALARRGQSERRPCRGLAAPARRRAAAPAGGVGWGTRTRQILLTGVSYMIPFVAAGGLLIALGFLFGGYEIANKPDGGTQTFGEHVCARQLAVRTCRPAASAVSRRGAVQPRRAGIQLPGACAGRLHRLRDRRPARHRTGVHRRRGRRVRRRRIHRRHRRRPHRRFRGTVDQHGRCRNGSGA